jgi:hypothetical protein
MLEEGERLSKELGDNRRLGSIPRQNRQFIIATRETTYYQCNTQRMRLKLGFKNQES